ncbi:MAG: hypothetical protein RR548_09960 [Carnobacterium sp.]|uniref:hypothetical protein n=1 Tax=Carnobacterium sp. TaxID=48221 RepID=UPI002FC5B169
MKLGKWRSQNEPVRIARKKTTDFERALKELVERGYTVTWRHETLNFAELRRL